jgi:H+/gluconate symporter-like permease
VVLAGAMVTYGGVSLFVAFFVLVPMAQTLFRDANIPRRLMPAAIALGTSTFTMTALPGTPAVQNAIPMPFFGTTPFAAPGLGLIAAAIMLAVRALVAGARRGVGAPQRHRIRGLRSRSRISPQPSRPNPLVRERATVAGTFDPPEVQKGQVSPICPRPSSPFCPCWWSSRSIWR